jgi:hypothetical protein
MPRSRSRLCKSAEPVCIDAAQRSQSRLDRSSPWGEGPSLIGTALYGAVRRVVWDPGANYSRGPDWLNYFRLAPYPGSWRTCRTAVMRIISGNMRKRKWIGNLFKLLRRRPVRSK